LPDFNFEYEIFAWVDSIVSYVVRKQNFAHRTLKKGEGSLLAKCVTAFAAVVLLPFAFALSCLSLAACRGSTITFVAYRQP
jgi:hypothetical protein